LGGAKSLTIGSTEHQQGGGGAGVDFGWGTDTDIIINTSTEQDGRMEKKACPSRTVATDTSHGPALGSREFLTISNN
jgi:hypothetical protein